MSAGGGVGPPSFGFLRGLNCGKKVCCLPLPDVPADCPEGKKSSSTAAPPTIGLAVPMGVARAGVGGTSFSESCSRGAACWDPSSDRPRSELEMDSALLWTLRPRAALTGDPDLDLPRFDRSTGDLTVLLVFERERLVLLVYERDRDRPRCDLPPPQLYGGRWE